MSRPRFGSARSSGPFVRINGKIRAREVRVVDDEGKQLGVLVLGEALKLARAYGVDLIEIAPQAQPPVCRLVDYGKYKYDQAKKDKEAKKHQHSTRVKEVQLTARIDPHDLKVKLMHAIGFLCEDNKVKASLRFRGRENAHKEFGFQTVNEFIKELEPFGTPDAPPRLAGRNLNVMISPLPRNKRAENPYAGEKFEGAPGTEESHPPKPQPQPQETDTPREANGSA